MWFEDESGPGPGAGGCVRELIGALGQQQLWQPVGQTGQQRSGAGVVDEQAAAGQEQLDRHVAFHEHLRWQRPEPLRIPLRADGEHHVSAAARATP